MIQMMKMLMLTLLVRLQSQRKDEKGAAVEWLIVLGIGIGIAYFAGDAVWQFAKSLTAKLGGR